MVYMAEILFLISLLYLHILCVLAGTFSTYLCEERTFSVYPLYVFERFTRSLSVHIFSMLQRDILYVRISVFRRGHSMCIPCVVEGTFSVYPLFSGGNILCSSSVF
jgi:hypothetical protein